MVKGRLFQFVYTVCQWVCYFFYLNVMWTACTLLGGIVFGAAPSTVALFAVARRKALGEEDIPVFRMFWQVYKKEFIKANGLGMSLIAFGMLWYFNLNFFRSFEGEMFFLMNVVMTVIGVVFIFMLFFIFPVYVHYDLKFIDNIKYAIAMSFLNLSNVILMVITMVSAYYFFITFPGFIPILGVSLFVQLNMWMAYQSFKKVKQKNTILQSKTA
ncbi:YesL family protein [Alteribacillus sp. HJP-4]|uniref:YesL family protein n=1 Tax=Alteribacillus sp. HJP-4 TaxID=2775394 RepID=UPI0035CCE802